MTLTPVVSLLLMLTSGPAAFQAPFDSLPLAQDRPFDSLPLAQDRPFDSLPLAQDRPFDSLPLAQDRPLHATIATGAAARETFVELSLLLIRQNRFEEAIVALRNATITAVRFAEPFDVAMARLQPLRVGDNIRAPIKVTDAKPVYPPIAQSARVQGVVIVEALVDDQGNVAGARVVQSIPLLNAAALDAVSKWKYAPADVDGRLVAVVMTVTVKFMLQ